MKVLVSIPAFNEEKNIAYVIKDVRKVLSDANYNFSIQIVDDGSTDKTKEIAEKEGAHVISHLRNKGLAKTFQTEMKEALKHNPDIIVHIDADRQYDAKEIISLINEINKGYDLVLGSRFKGYIEKMPIIKKIGNKLFSFLVSQLAGIKITDSQTGFRAFTPEVAQYIKINSSYTYTQEQLLRAINMKFKIKEIPIQFYSRKDNTTSRLMCNPFQYAGSAGINVMRIYRDLRPLTFFGIAGVLMIIPGILIGLYFICSCKNY